MGIEILQGGSLVVWASLRLLCSMLIPSRSSPIIAFQLGRPPYRWRSALHVECKLRCPRDHDSQAVSDLHSLRSFQLAIHWETRTSPSTHSLGQVVSSSGRQSQRRSSRAPFRKCLRTISLPHLRLVPSRCPSKVRFSRFPWAALFFFLVERTGLTGTYYMDLKWAGDNSPQSSLPSLPSALKEQFGLELKSETGSVDGLVIDHVEKPLPN